MAIDSPMDLFLYELGVMYNAENDGGHLLGWLGGQVRDQDLAQTLRQEEDSQRQLRNLESCFQALRGSPLDVESATVESIRSAFEDFVSLQPSPEALELHAFATAMRLNHLGIASYKSLVDRAMHMGETGCARCLQTNLVQKEENAGKLERVGHEMGQRVLAAA